MQAAACMHAIAINKSLAESIYKPRVYARRDLREKVFL